MTTFIRCEKCGKKLIERKPNGVWHFLFGKSVKGYGPPVDIQVYGSIAIKCLRRSCGHVNILHFVPTPQGELLGEQVNQPKAEQD